MVDARWAPIVLGLFLSLATGASAQCYLMDADSTCEVCWVTTYSSAEDSTGITKASECPADLVEKWDIAPPEKMVAQKAYPVRWSVKFNTTKYSIVKQGTKGHVNHANIHSCIASRGVCSPFVANTPGLATHTKALTSDLAGDGTAVFDSEVSLTAEVYTIIAHVRFYVPNPVDNTSKPTKYDLAIGTTRTVVSQSTLCEGGSRYDADKDECVVCPAGTYQDGLECKKCENGTYGPIAGLSHCLPCSEGYTDSEGMVECSECPARTMRRPGSDGVSILECLCIPGSYPKNGPGKACEVCPTGADCDGGSSWPYPKPGFWGDERCMPDSQGNSACAGYDRFYECNPPSDCAGGRDFACAVGHTGAMCKVAERGFYTIGGTFYPECGENGGIVSIVGIILVILVWLAINKVASGNYDAMDIALLFVQITGMISTFGLKWHRNLESINTALSIANFDVDFVTPLCLGPWTAFHSFYTQLMLPVIYGAGCLLYYSSGCLYSNVIKKEGRTFQEFKDKLSTDMVNKVLSFVIVMYHTLCLKCFQAFRCTTYPDDKPYMYFFPGVECYQSEHIGMMVVSALYIPIVLIGFPSYMAYVVNKAAKDGSLHNRKFMDKYSFIFSRYDPGYKWWESVLIFRRFAIALISVVFDTSLLQAAFTIVLLVTLLTAHTHTRPFVSDQIDNLEVFTICGSIFYALAGMLFYPSITADAQGFICTDATNSACSSDQSLKNIISIVLLTWIIATLVYAFVVSYLCVLEVNRSHKAQRVMKVLMGVEEERQGITDVMSNFKSFSRAPSAESGGGKQHPAPKARKEEEEGPHAADVHLFSGDFKAAVAASANRLTLDDLVTGKEILTWSQEVTKRMTPDARRKCLEDFEVVTLGLLALERDVTHFSDTHYAEMIRQVSAMDGVVDFLCDCTHEQRKSLVTFTDAFSAWMDEKEKVNAAKSATFPLHEVVLPEHGGVLISYIMNASDEDVRRVRRLLRDFAEIHAGGAMSGRVAPSSESDSERSGSDSSTMSPTRILPAALPPIPGSDISEDGTALVSAGDAAPIAIEPNDSLQDIGVIS